ncbi:MAG: hypothetical protein AAGK77_10545 [Pseudomonadota bacterium]
MTHPAPINLSTDEAIAYLASFGVVTSRSGLDQMRDAGKLAWIKARGRVRVLYRPADLLTAFLDPQDAKDDTWASRSTNAATSGTSEAPLPGSAYAKALALATRGKPMRSECGSKGKPSNVTALDATRP